MTRIKISYLFTFLSKCKQTELQQQQHLKTRQKITKNVSLALVHKKSITSLVHCFFYKKMSRNLTNKKQTLCYAEMDRWQNLQQQMLA